MQQIMVPPQQYFCHMPSTSIDPNHEILVTDCPPETVMIIVTSAVTVVPGAYLRQQKPSSNRTLYSPKQLQKWL